MQLGDILTFDRGVMRKEVTKDITVSCPLITIVYTGTIYEGKQDPTRLFAALRELFDEGLGESDIEVEFYGDEQAWLQEEIERYELLNTVFQCGRVSRKAALQIQREADILLVLKWEDPQENGVYTGKVFEYLGARRPILATGGHDDVVTELLLETGAGVCASTVQEIKEALVGFIRDCRNR